MTRLRQLVTRALQDLKHLAQEQITTYIQDKNFE